MKHGIVCRLLVASITALSFSMCAPTPPTYTIPGGGGGGGESSPLASNCTTTSAAYGSKCIDSSGLDQWSLFTCGDTNGCTGTATQWKRENGILYIVTENPNNPGPGERGECTVGFQSKCACQTALVDRAFDMIEGEGNFAYQEWVCSNPGMDLWSQMGTTQGVQQFGSAPDPNDFYGTDQPLECYHAWLDNYISSSSITMWTCISTVTDEWVFRRGQRRQFR